MRRLALHWQILIMMVAGVAFGILAARMGWGEFVRVAIYPFGRLFMNLLLMIAVPLVLFSLVAGVASLNDTRRLSRIGGKTIGLYVATTAIAITIGLTVANLFRPGSGISPETRDALQESSRAAAEGAIARAESLSVVDQLIDIVPRNPFDALAGGNMLQVVFFALMLGIGVTLLGGQRTARVGALFQDLSDAVIAMVRLIMLVAPLGVFALLAHAIVQVGEDPERQAELFTALLGYMGCVVLGLLLHLGLVYLPLLRLLARVGPRQFLRAMAPAQLLAFSSSSSAATLPVTMACAEKRLGVDDEVSSFVLPLGATINMDGTALYQGVAAIFIANVYGLDLSLGAQLSILLTATLASIGTAAVPGVGLIMLTIVLRQAQIPVEGIALILGVDRPLDMLRTAINVSGDATVATLVARSEGMELRPQAT